MFNGLSSSCHQSHADCDFPRQRHFREALSSECSHLPYKHVPADPAPIICLLQHIHRLPTSSLLRTKRPELVRSHGGSNQHFIDGRLFLRLCCINSAIAILNALVENGLVVSKCLFEVFELSHLAVQSLLCSLDSLLLSLQRRNGSQVLADSLLCLLSERRREGFK